MMKLSKKRAKFYSILVRWTSIPLAVLMWVMLMTGTGLFKGDLLGKLTLGLINPASAGKWHSVWLPVIAAVVIYTHTTVGLEILVTRTKRLKPKWIWELVVLLIGLGALGQFLWLYYA